MLVVRLEKNVRGYGMHSNLLQKEEARELVPPYDTYDWVDRYDLLPRQKADIKKRAAQWKAGSPFWEAVVK